MLGAARALAEADLLLLEATALCNQTANQTPARYSIRGDEIPRSGAVGVLSAPLSDARIDAGLLVVSPALLPGAVPIG